RGGVPPDDGRRAPRARGVRDRGRAPDARPPADGGGVGTARLRRRRVGQVVARDALHAGVPPAPLRQDRAQPETPRAAHAAGARGVRQDRRAAVRGHAGLDAGRAGDGTPGAGRALPRAGGDGARALSPGGCPSNAPAAANDQMRVLGAASGVLAPPSFRRPRWGTGARYGASVATSRRSSGTVRTASRNASAFLKVTMPATETENPRSR